MRQIRIGDVTIDAVIEREGPWRRPQDFFPAYDEAVFRHHLPSMEPEVFDPALGHDGHHLPDLRRANAALHDPGRHLHRRGQGPSAAVRFSRQGALAQRIVRARHQITTRSIMCSAPIFISTTPAGTPRCATAAGCRRSRTRNTSFTKTNMRPGRRRTRKAPIRPARYSATIACPIVEAGQALLVDDDYALDDTITLDADAGTFALPLLRQHLLPRPARRGGRRSHASRDPVPRARLVRQAGLGPEAIGGVAPEVFHVGSGDRHADPADPLPDADGRPDHVGWGPVRLPVQARLNRRLVSRATHCNERVSPLNSGEPAPRGFSPAINSQR